MSPGDDVLCRGQAGRIIRLLSLTILGETRTLCAVALPSGVVIVAVSELRQI